MFSVKNNFFSRLFVLILSCELINLISHLINSDVNSYNLIFKGAFAICPHKCHCDNLNLKVLCSNANLDLVPIIFNPELRVLQLDSNVIQKIKNSSFNVYRHIENLNLSFNRIILIEDNSFIQLKRLKILHLEQNKIGFLTNETLNGLASLEELHLNDNNISIINGPVFKDLNSLELLDLSFNGLKYLSKDSFAGLYNLRYLYLRQNHLSWQVNQDFAITFNLNITRHSHHIPLEALSSRYLSNLIRLDLGQNNFTHITKNVSPFSSRSSNQDNTWSHNSKDNGLDLIESENIPFWPNLQELYLDRCSLTYIEPGSFDALDKLSMLRLRHNQFQKLPIDALEDFPSLEVLEIGDNLFEKIESNAFSMMGNLKSLDISRCSKLKDIEEDAFNGLNNLERLELSENSNLEYINPLLFVNMNHLKYLSLRKNSITSLDPSLAYLNGKVKILDLRGNSFICNCNVQWIRRLFLNYQSRLKDNTIRSLYSSDLNRDGNNFRLLKDSLLNEKEIIKSSTNESFVDSPFSLRCASPFPLRGKLIIDLNPEDFGCVEVESLAPIVIGIIIGLMFLFGVIIIFAIRFNAKLTSFIKRSNVQKPQFPKKIATINNNRKVFGLPTITTDFDYHHYAKPDYIVVHNMINVPSTTINSLSSNPYEVVPIQTPRMSRESDSPVYQSDFYSSEFSHYPFRPRPITEL